MYGIDVSRNNGVIDWAQVKAQGRPKVDFAFIKATEGVDFIDKKLLTNAQASHDAGIPRGFYHFASLNNHNEVKDAQDEAHDFLEAIHYVEKPELPLVLDIEKNLAHLDKLEVFIWAKTFLEVLEANGHKDPIVYSYAAFLNENLPSNHDLGKYRLWLAGYVKPERLIIPKGWTKYWLWQYSANGTVKGIVGSVDENISHEPIF